uniref:Ribosomal protein L32 n=2 Tax=Ostreobium TaxID=121087 RepID=A0A1A8H2K8_9CHLO|nr:Ribosomal protein L32 [Ostreobium quekettii]ANG44441.1 ribosomal protein L32 [Ostreobium sp. OS1B]SBQ76970.1 Ribosomal protein L32 [Ostreobium quekettii]
MAAPKRRLSKIKTKIRKRIWKNKANKKVLNALNWANLLLKNLQKN